MGGSYGWFFSHTYIIGQCPISMLVYLSINLIIDWLMFWLIDDRSVESIDHQID